MTVTSKLYILGSEAEMNKRAEGSLNPKDDLQNEKSKSRFNGEVKVIPLHNNYYREEQREG